MKIKKYIFASLAFTLSITFSAEAGVRQGYYPQQVHNHRFDLYDWHYEDYADTTTGITLHRAYKISNSFVNSATGRLHATLFIGTRAKASPLNLYVHFAIKQENGYAYFDCQTCKITVQFDDNAPEEIEAKIISPGMSVALNDPAGLVEKIKNANQVKITAPIKDDGQITIEFTTSELEWPRDDKPATSKNPEKPDEDSGSN